MIYLFDGLKGVQLRNDSAGADETEECYLGNKI
jgi:hypothetical protein